MTGSPGYLFTISKRRSTVYIVYGTRVLRGLHFPAQQSQVHNSLPLHSVVSHQWHDKEGKEMTGKERGRKKKRKGSRRGSVEKNEVKVREWRRKTAENRAVVRMRNCTEGWVQKISQRSHFHLSLHPSKDGHELWNGWRGISKWVWQLSRRLSMFQWDV